MLTSGITMRVMSLAAQNDDLARSAMELRVNRQQYKDLRQSGAILKQYGMTRPLVAALDHDGLLTRLANAPSTESLDLIPLPPQSSIQRAVVEKLEESLSVESQLVADWISQETDRLKAILDGLEITTDKLGTATAALKQALESSDATISADQVRGLEVTATPAQLAATCLVAFTNALDQLEPIDIDALMTDPEYRAQCWTGLMALCHATEKETLVDVDGDNDDITHGAQAVFETGDPLTLGYDPDTLDAILDDVLSYLGVVKSIIDKKDEFISSLQAAADRTPDAAPVEEAISITDATSDNAPVDTGAAVANVPQDGESDTNTAPTGTDDTTNPEGGDGSTDASEPDNTSGSTDPDDTSDADGGDLGDDYSDDVDTDNYAADDHGEVVSKYACLLSGLITNGMKISIAAVAVADAYMSLANAAGDSQ